MKKWLIAFTASAVLIGCGGGNGLSNLNGGGTGGGGTTGRGLPTVTLGSMAQAQILILSGSGRRGPDSQIATFDNLRIFNTVTDFQPTDLQGSGSPLRVLLDGYTLNQFVFDVPLTTGGPSKTYTQFPLEVKTIEQVEPPTVLFTGPLDLSTLNGGKFFNLNMDLFPGRQTTIQILLNDTSLDYNTTSNQVEFNRTQFETENYAPYNNKINGFLSDMISFDVSALPIVDRPTISTGEVAEMAHFSGDSIGISGPFHFVNNVPKATFDLLNPVVVDSGILTKEQVVGIGQPAPGIYNVMEPDPRDPFGNSKVTSIQGIYRPYTSVLSNMDVFSMVAIPTSRNSTVNQVVVFNRNAAGTITAMWQGIVDFNKATTGVIRLFSLKDLPNAAATPKATGTVTFTKVNGVVKQGLFNISVAPINFPFPKTGGFVVLR